MTEAPEDTPRTDTVEYLLATLETYADLYRGLLKLYGDQDARMAHLARLVRWIVIIGAGGITVSLLGSAVVIGMLSYHMG